MCLSLFLFCILVCFDRGSRDDPQLSRTWFRLQWSLVFRFSLNTTIPTADHDPLKFQSNFFNFCWNDQFQFQFLRRSEIKAEVGGYSGSLSDLGWNYQTPRTPLKPPDGNIGPHCNEWAGNAMHCATSSQALQWAVDKNAMQCISLQCTSLKYTVHEMHCSRHWSRLFCFALHFDSSTLWHL